MTNRTQPTPAPLTTPLTPSSERPGTQDFSYVLGLETSCDETAAAIVRSDGKIMANIVYSQLDDHRIFGGVVPEIAARAHLSVLDGLISTAFEVAGLNRHDINAVAATAGPGLIGGVLVGLVTGKAMASALNVPLIAVNHLEGHALTPRLTDNVAFPYVLLLISGGHSQIVLVEDVGLYHRLGTTIDDALGEAFDKTAKLLDLGYPGGPAVERWAHNGDSHRFELPRPLIGKPGCHFSFSGLKTAIRRHADAMDSITDQDRHDLCASFQHAVVDILARQVKKGIDAARQKTQRPLTALVAAGGVAANATLRHHLIQAAQTGGLPFIAPPAALCTDNGAMIAWAGLEKLKRHQTDTLDAPARARWPLDAHADPAPGVKAGARPKA